MPEEPSKNIEHRKITYNINIFDGKMEGFLPSYCDEINLTGIIVWNFPRLYIFERWNKNR